MADAIIEVKDVEFRYEMCIRDSVPSLLFLHSPSKMVQEINRRAPTLSSVMLLDVYKRQGCITEIADITCFHIEEHFKEAFISSRKG